MFRIFSSVCVCYSIQTKNNFALVYYHLVVKPELYSFDFVVYSLNLLFLVLIFIKCMTIWKFSRECPILSFLELGKVAIFEINFCLYQCFLSDPNF